MAKLSNVGAVEDVREATTGGQGGLAKTATGYEEWSGIIDHLARRTSHTLPISSLNRDGSLRSQYQNARRTGSALVVL